MDSNSAIIIPTTPPKGLLESMAMRYNHSFALSAQMTDEQIMHLRASNIIMGNQYLTFHERQLILTTMSQLHEEVVGKGFYKYD